MKQLALALAATVTLGLGIPASPAVASIETVEAKYAAAEAAAMARADMFSAFGDQMLKPGQYLWRDVPAAGPPRVIISLSDQLAFFYRGSTLLGVATVSSGKPGKETPTGIFTVLEKKPMHRSRKYDNAPMPFMQRIDTYGIALHAGHNPGEPASRGCIRLPSPFASKLFKQTSIGTEVLIGA